MFPTFKLYQSFWGLFVANNVLITWIEVYEGIQRFLLSLRNRHGFTDALQRPPKCGPLPPATIRARVDLANAWISTLAFLAGNGCLLSSFNGGPQRSSQLITL